MKVVNRLNAYIVVKSIHSLLRSESKTNLKNIKYCKYDIKIFCNVLYVNITKSSFARVDNFVFIFIRNRSNLGLGSKNEPVYQ